jgi:hypothetical protein
MFHQFVVWLVSTVGQWRDTGIVRAKKLCLRIDVEGRNIHKRSIDIKKTKADTLPVVSLNSDYERLSGIHTLMNSVDISGDLSTLAKGSVKSRDLMLKAAKKQKAMIEVLLVCRVKAGYCKPVRSPPAPALVYTFDVFNKQ